jgi:hypothetical protein
MQAVLKTNKSSDRRAVDDGTFIVKHFSNFMLHANPFQVYGNGFIPIFLCAISRGSRISFNTGIVKA